MIALKLLLISAIYTLTPVSTTVHFTTKDPSTYTQNSYPGKEFIRIKGHQINAHPELILKAEWKYIQAIGGSILYDTEGHPAFPLLVGPRYKNIGLVLGGEFRPVHFPPSSHTFGPRKFYSTGDDFGPGRMGSWEFIPIYGLTYTYSVKCFQVQILLNHSLLNIGLGIILGGK